MFMFYLSATMYLQPLTSSETLQKKEELCNVHLSEQLLCFCTLPATITGL